MTPCLHSRMSLCLSSRHDRPDSVCGQHHGSDLQLVRIWYRPGFLPEEIALQKEAEDLVPSPRSQQSDSASPAVRGMVKAAIEQVRDNLKRNKERDRALSTVTQLPDDIAWRDAEGLDSDDNDSDTSNDSAAQQYKRHSAEEAPAHAKVCAGLFGCSLTLSRSGVAADNTGYCVPGQW